MIDLDEFPHLVTSPVYNTYFHVTPVENWNLIQESGQLFGNLKNPYYRYTYLAPTRHGALQYAGWTPSRIGLYTLLKVHYEPKGRTPEGWPCDDNYDFLIPQSYDIIQVRVYVPIPLSDVEKLETYTLERIRSQWKSIG